MDEKYLGNPKYLVKRSNIKLLDTNAHLKLELQIKLKNGSQNNQLTIIILFL